MDAVLDFIYSNNVICPSLDSESHFMAGAEWKAHSHESKSLKSPPATQSSSSHHFCLFSVLLCLSAPLVTVLRAVCPCTCPLPFSLTHPRELLLPWEESSAWLLSLYPSITHWHTHACRKVLLHTATMLAIIFCNPFFPDIHIWTE